jgi:uncharacterized protein involved in tolerance to divalent cations
MSPLNAISSTQHNTSFSAERMTLLNICALYCCHNHQTTHQCIHSKYLHMSSLFHVLCHIVNTAIMCACIQVVALEDSLLGSLTKVDAAAEAAIQSKLTSSKALSLETSTAAHGSYAAPPKSPLPHALGLNRYTYCFNSTSIHYSIQCSHLVDCSEPPIAS